MFNSGGLKNTQLGQGIQAILINTTACGDTSYRTEKTHQHSKYKSQYHAHLLNASLVLLLLFDEGVSQSNPGGKK